MVCFHYNIGRLLPVANNAVKAILPHCAQFEKMRSSKIFRCTAKPGGDTPCPPNLKLNVGFYGPMRCQKLILDGRTWTQRRDNRVLMFSFSGKVGFWGARDWKMLKLWDHTSSKQAISRKRLKLDISSKKVFWSAFLDVTFVKISSKSENFLIGRTSNSKF